MFRIFIQFPEIPYSDDFIFNKPLLLIESIAIEWNCELKRKKYLSNKATVRVNTSIFVSQFRKKRRKKMYFSFILVNSPQEF